MPAADPGTGHYPATHTRAGGGKGTPTITAVCSCGWKHPASSQEHSNSLFRTHHLDETGSPPPPPTPPTRRTR